MNDSRRIIRILQDARELVRDDWGSGNPDIGFDESSGRHCASVAIQEACGLVGVTDLTDACHAALLHGADLPVPEGDALYEAVFEFNDSQPSRRNVMAAFDKAIAILGAGLAEPTPNADATLAVMEACATAGQVLAHYIVAEHSNLDEREVAEVASSELFYAAQDTARACSVGVKLERA